MPSTTDWLAEPCGCEAANAVAAHARTAHPMSAKRMIVDCIMRSNTRFARKFRRMDSILDRTIAEGFDARARAPAAGPVG